MNERTPDERAQQGTSQSETTAGHPARNGVSASVAALLGSLNRFGAVYVLVLSFVIFSLLKPATFLTPLNVRTLLISESILAIISIGLMIPAAAGEFDLSVGYLAGFTGIEVASMAVNGHWPPALAVAAGLATGAVVGAFNGILVVVVGINSFIASLGTGTILLGLTIWLSNGAVVFGIPDSIIFLGQARFLGLAFPVWVMFAVVIVVFYVFYWRPFGRYLYAIGGGRDAARLAGVATGWMVFLSLLLSALLAGLAGILFMANAGAADPLAGPDLLLPAFAAIFLGSTTITPGRFNVIGTLVALFLLAVLVDGLQQLGAPSWVSPVFNGVALIGAVGLAVSRQR